MHGELARRPSGLFSDMPTPLIKQSNQELFAIDYLIRTAQMDGARESLTQIFPTLDRPQWALATNLAWRCGLAPLGIRFLHPVIRTHGRLRDQPGSFEERLEYAACLVKLGRIKEANDLMLPIDSALFPKILLYRAFAHISEWNYPDAIGLIKSYLVSETDEYFQSVGQVNLAESLIAMRQFLGAEALLRQCMNRSKIQCNHLVYAKVLELYAQLSIATGQWKRADTFLAEAQLTFGNSPLKDMLFIGKWRAISQLWQHPDAPDTGALLKEVRALANKVNHWETLRDLDRHEAIVKKDENLMIHLFFGTPFETFRKELLIDFGQPLRTDCYDWTLGEGTSSLSFDLIQVAIRTSSRRDSRLSRTIHRALVSLCSDFYRPWQLARLHAELYPNEYYHPVSSPIRVHAVIGRLRTWFKKQKFPVTIRSYQDTYRLECTDKAITIRTYAPRILADPASVLLAQIARRWPNGPFTSRGVSVELKVSTVTAFRILIAGEKAGRILRFGKGKNTRYRCIQSAE